MAARRLSHAMRHACRAVPRRSQRSAALDAARTASRHACSSRSSSPACPLARRLAASVRAPALARLLAMAGAPTRERGGLAAALAARFGVIRQADGRWRRSRARAPASIPQRRSGSPPNRCTLAAGRSDVRSPAASTTSPRTMPRAGRALNPHFRGRRPRVRRAAARCLVRPRRDARPDLVDRIRRTPRSADDAPQLLPAGADAAPGGAGNGDPDAAARAPGQRGREARGRCAGERRVVLGRRDAAATAACRAVSSARSPRQAPRAALARMSARRRGDAAADRRRGARRGCRRRGVDAWSRSDPARRRRRARARLARARRRVALERGRLASLRCSPTRRRTPRLERAPPRSGSDSRGRRRRARSRALLRRREQGRLMRDRAARGSRRRGKRSRPPACTRCSRASTRRAAWRRRRLDHALAALPPSRA